MIINYQSITFDNIRLLSISIRLTQNNWVGDNYSFLYNCWNFKASATFGYIQSVEHSFTGHRTSLILTIASEVLSHSFFMSKFIFYFYVVENFFVSEFKKWRVLRKVTYLRVFVEDFEDIWKIVFSWQCTSLATYLQRFTFLNMFFVQD